MTDLIENITYDPNKPLCRICAENDTVTELENTDLWLIDIPERSFEPAHTSTICNTCANGFSAKRIKFFNLRKPTDSELSKYGENSIKNLPSHLEIVAL